MRFSLFEYNAALMSLCKGMTQLVPDGKPCPVCTKSGHVASECLLNPLALIEILKQENAEILEGKLKGANEKPENPDN